MTLTPKELTHRSREAAEMFREALDEAERNGGPYARIANTEFAFTNFMTAGVAQWRSGVSPARDFLCALDAIDNGLLYLSSHPPACDTVLLLSTHLASLLSYLLFGEIPAKYLSTLPRPETLPAKHRKLQDHSYLTLIVWTLSAAAIPPESNIIAEAPRATRALLSRETFRAHLELLREVNDGQITEATLHKVEALYVKRCRSSYYEGGADYWGGGPMNPFMLDFEAAAILCLAERRGHLPLPTVHRWAWAA